MRLLRRTTVLASLAVLVTLSGQGIAQENDWRLVEARRTKASEPLVPGWRCTSVLDVPGAAPGTLALCRSATPSGPGRIHVVWQTRAPGSAPKALFDLADASSASMRLYRPPSDCAAGTPCLSAVVLVDQGDEGGCYGTAVMSSVAGQPFRKLGFIDEWSPAHGEAHCIGSTPRVTGAGATITIVVPGPLARTGRDGKPVKVAAAQVAYRISVEGPKLLKLPR